MRRFLLLIPLAIYFALALPQLDLPGLHNDEAVEAGLQAEQILSGQSITIFRDTGLTLGDRTFPLMVQDYIGALNVYLLLPFFVTLGPTVFALRLYTVLTGAATIVCTYGFLAYGVGRRPAWVAAMLLVVSPSFIFWQRQGVFVTSLTSTLTVASLWVGAVWARRGGWQWMALLGLLCGLGLYAKLLFVWIIAGTAGALAVVNGLILIHQKATRRLFRLPHLSFTIFPRTPSLADVIAFGVGIFIGVLPLVIYNLQTSGTILSIGENLTTSYYGVNNLNVAENLRGRIDQFQAVLAGRDHLWYLGGSFGNPGWETALRVAALAIGIRALLFRQRSRLPLTTLLLLALGVLQTSFTVSGLFPTHFAIFTPLWPILVALASEIIFDPFYEPLMIHVNGPPLSMFTGGWVSGWLGFLNMGMLVLAVALGALWARDVVVTVEYHRALNASGGLGPHSDAVYRLSQYLESNGDWSVAAMDWGFGPQVALLTRGRILPQEIFGYNLGQPDEGFRDRLETAAANPATLFVFHLPQETIFPRREAFDHFVAAQGWTTEQVAVISRRDGAPVYEIVRLKK